jgi:cytochrome c oxidase subunit 4
MSTNANGSMATSTHHVVSWKVYLAVFLALCALTVLTTEVARYDFGELNLIVALAIAVAKASLVILFFMHARYSERLTALVIATAVAFLFILVFLTMSDYATRAWSLVAAGS